MLKYLIILLDDMSISYCHYENSKTERKRISLQDLKAGVLFAMKENLMIQFVYPDYELPQEYKEVIVMVEHTNIMSAVCCGEADVVVMNSWKALASCCLSKDMVYVLRLKKADFFNHYSRVGEVFANVARLNIILTDIETFTEKDLDRYRCILRTFSSLLRGAYESGETFQLNLLTDRMMLDGMNNCNAGWESITLAPDGKFYACPAFYLSDDACCIGSLKDGLNIKNPQLYCLDYAPLCRNCDAYQCKRCVWLNWKTTLEVNTPSHEQCVTAHLERNASRDLLQEIRKIKDFLSDKEIKEINYLDPFEIRKQF